MENNNKMSVTTAILLMIITALVVYSVMMYRFNQYLNSEELALSFSVPVQMKIFQN